ncbi:MAG: ABC transporter substrate-binding protein [Candidatus Acetothermia bacterium]|jgi:hypothetical protein|nr:ABC transporter substrate-binding protein [Candidatus Acetothermia bacterium]
MVLAVLGLSLLSAVALGARQGGVLRIRAMDLQNIDPMKLLGRNDDIHVASQIFDSLVILGKDDFLPKPELATSWELVDDTTWIFHLREGAMFQDDNEVFPKGQAREVVADDVAYSIQRAKELAPNLNLASITSVRAIDRYTVLVILSQAVRQVLQGHGTDGLVGMRTGKEEELFRTVADAQHADRLPIRGPADGHEANRLRVLPGQALGAPVQLIHGQEPLVVRDITQHGIQFHVRPFHERENGPV